MGTEHSEESGQKYNDTDLLRLMGDENFSDFLRYGVFEPFWRKRLTNKDNLGKEGASSTEPRNIPQHSRILKHFRQTEICVWDTIPSIMLPAYIRARLDSLMEAISKIEGGDGRKVLLDGGFVEEETGAIKLDGKPVYLNFRRLERISKTTPEIVALISQIRSLLWVYITLESLFEDCENYKECYQLFNNLYQYPAFQNKYLGVDIFNSWLCQCSSSKEVSKVLAEMEISNISPTSATLHIMFEACSDFEDCRSLFKALHTDHGNLQFLDIELFNGWLMHCTTVAQIQEVEEIMVANGLEPNHHTFYCIENELARELVAETEREQEERAARLAEIKQFALEDGMRRQAKRTAEEVTYRKELAQQKRKSQAEQAARFTELLDHPELEFAGQTEQEVYEQPIAEDESPSPPVESEPTVLKEKPTTQAPNLGFEAYLQQTRTRLEAERKAEEALKAKKLAKKEAKKQRKLERKKLSKGQRKELNRQESAARAKSRREEEEEQQKHAAEMAAMQAQRAATPPAAPSPPTPEIIPEAPLLEKTLNAIGKSTLSFREKWVEEKDKITELSTLRTLFASDDSADQNLLNAAIDAIIGAFESELGTQKTCHQLKWNKGLAMKLLDDFRYQVGQIVASASQRIERKGKDYINRSTELRTAFLGSLKKGNIPHPVHPTDYILSLFPIPKARFMNYVQEWIAKNGAIHFAEEMCRTNPATIRTGTYIGFPSNLLAPNPVDLAILIDSTIKNCRERGGKTWQQDFDIRQINSLEAQKLSTREEKRQNIYQVVFIKFVSIYSYYGRYSNLDKNGSKLISDMKSFVNACYKILPESFTPEEIETLKSSLEKVLRARFKQIHQERNENESK